ncbi:MAG: phosphate signaling complex protein PhoU [Bradyrhizobium sp.]|nr:phosphate signaling complex protein PhoU [Bradyrhizobium sp.]
MSEHTVKSYDQELEALNRMIAEMGGLAEKMLSDSIDALENLDVELAHRVVSTDTRLDLLQGKIEESAVLTIARRQPMAIDLRECIAAVRISGDIERVGDLAKNLARRTTVLAAEGLKLQRAIPGLRAMQDMAASQLKDVLDAYAERDPERAKLVWSEDTKLDALEDSVFRDLLTSMMEDPRNISPCTHLLFCSKNLERIGDHTTNIAETVVYLVTGQTMPLDRPKGSRWPSVPGDS